MKLSRVIGPGGYEIPEGNAFAYASRRKNTPSHHRSLEAAEATPILFVGRTHGRSQEASLFAEALPHVPYLIFSSSQGLVERAKAILDSFESQRQLLILASEERAIVVAIRQLAKIHGRVVIVLLDYRWITKTSAEVAVHWPISVDREWFDEFGLTSTLAYWCSHIKHNFQLLNSVWDRMG